MILYGMTDLSALIVRHLPAPGIFDTLLDGIQLFRVDTPVPRVNAVYPPSICAIVQGTKQAYLHGRSFVYEAGQALCVTMSIPIEAEVPTATPQNPVLGLLVSLESRVAVETIVACQAAPTSTPPVARVTGADNPSGLGVVRWDPAFSDALRRILALLGHPEEARILGPGRVRELIYAAIQGEAGALIRGHLSEGQEIAQIVGYVRDHLHESISVDDLARRVGMSRAVFDRRFKAVTTYAPLQFIKAMRLNNAALLLRQGATVSEAAYAVGYASASQFSREFSRQFHMPPRAWGRSFKREVVQRPTVPFMSSPTSVTP